MTDQTFTTPPIGDREPREASPEDVARFEARVTELKDAAFNWFACIHDWVETDCLHLSVPVLIGVEKEIVIRILRDGLPCCEEQCETLAREILKEGG